MLQISFVEHEIPNILPSAVSNNKVFYHSENHIFFYEISSKQHFKFINISRPSFLFSLKNSYLCVINGNILKIFNSSNLSKNVPEIKLRKIPLKVIQYKDNLGFIYNNSMELLFVKKDAIDSTSHSDISHSLMFIDFTFEVFDVCCSTDFTFILTKNKILRTRNIFITKSILGLTQMSGISNNPESITAIGNQIYINSQNKSLFLIKNDTVEKYEINDRLLVLEYSFKLNEGINTMAYDYLLGDDLIHLSKAPFLIIKDKISSLAMIDEMKALVGVSPNRIYFIKETIESVKNEVSYDMKNYSTTVNCNLFKIPEIFKNNKADFIKNEIKICKYEILLKKIEELTADMNEKEKELKKMQNEIESEMKSLEEKRAVLEKRVIEIKAMAKNKQFKKFSAAFYSKINILEKLIDEDFNIKGWNEFITKLKAQKYALLNKLN